MNLKEYQESAKRTLPDLGSDKLNLSHMVMGMSSELSELYDAELKDDSVNIEEEKADIMWYVANYANIRNIDLEALSQSERLPGNKPVFWYISELTDLVKRYVAYNKPIDINKEYSYLDNIIYHIKRSYLVTDEERFVKSLKNNIDKLRVRYPEKFNDYDAINRNLEQERKELEK